MYLIIVTTRCHVYTDCFYYLTCIMVGAWLHALFPLGSITASCFLGPSYWGLFVAIDGHCHDLVDVALRFNTSSPLWLSSEYLTSCHMDFKYCIS